MFTYDPISPVAMEISSETCILCFDEFQVSGCAGVVFVCVCLCVCVSVCVCVCVRVCDSLLRYYEV